MALAISTETKHINAVLMAATITPGYVFELGKRTMLGVTVKTTAGVGTPDHVGAVTFELCNNPQSDTPVAISTISVTIATGAVNNHYVELCDIAAPYIRAVYTRSSGGDDDTLTVTFCAKE
jgi:hypothetical protein